MGPDNIVGDAGRDILIGGYGPDTINANDDEQDIVAEGYTNYDGRPQISAIDKLGNTLRLFGLQTWTQTNARHESRRALATPCRAAPSH